MFTIGFEKSCFLSVLSLAAEVGDAPGNLLAAESRAKSAANVSGVSGETCRTEKERERFLVVRMDIKEVAHV